MRPLEPDARPYIAPGLIQIRRNGLNSTFCIHVVWRMPVHRPDVRLVNFTPDSAGACVKFYCGWQRVF